MTLQRTHTRSVLTPGQVCFGFFSIFCLFLILRNSDTAIEYMSRGLLLCAKTVIPSLFPFMVLSELIVSGGFGNAVLQRISRPLQRLFGISEDGCCAVLLGMVCGFPVGAKCAMLSYDSGRMSRAECERVLCFANAPSSAFLISAVGVSLWGNRRFGVMLYLTVILSALITGIGMNLFSPKRRKEELGTSVPLPKEAPLSGPKLFTRAVRSSTESILLVCAYVVFFSAFTGTLNLILSQCSIPHTVHAALSGAFELSGGMSQAAALENTKLAALMCAGIAGWSGLSVHCQVLSVCDGRGLSFRPYFLAKIVQSVLCVLIFAGILCVFPDLTVPAESCAALDSWMYLI
ncbi:MAG: hypothetical protein IJW92_03015 [Clostridia bacterium]|nr:hypothetical protein [Clostridia bacterium]